MELFSRAGAKGVRITVGISGTGGGFQRFCKGETDLSDASRPMKIVEAQSCKDNSIGGWRAFTVANDALTVVVNQQNTWAKCLSVEELKKIWDTGSTVDNWKDVRAGFPERTEVQAFLDYIFDHEAQIAERARFVPLTKAQLKRARTKFDLAVKAARRS